MYLLLIFFMTLIIPLLVMPREIKLGAISPYRIVLHAALTVSAIALAVFIAASITGESVYQQINVMIQDIAGILAKDPMTVDMFNLTDINIDERTDVFVKLYQEVFKPLPAMIMTFSAVIAYFEYIILSKFMRKRFQSVKIMPKLREFSIPGGAVWAIMIMYIASWALTSSEMFSNDLLYMNMDLIFDFVFSLQGISVLMMLFHMKRIPKPIGVIAIILVWGTSVGRMLLVMVGMFDIILGLKIRIQSNGSRR